MTLESKHIHTSDLKIIDQFYSDRKDAVTHGCVLILDVSKHEKGCFRSRWEQLSQTHNFHISLSVIAYISTQRSVLSVIGRNERKQCRGGRQSDTRNICRQMPRSLSFSSINRTGFKYKPLIETTCFGDQILQAQHGRQCVLVECVNLTTEAHLDHTPLGNARAFTQPT